jgi:hypothetical protein
MLADSAFDLDSWLRGEFAKRCWRGLSAAARSGTSTATWLPLRALPLLGVEDLYERPLYVPSVNTDNLDKILGIPVVIDRYAPAIAAGTSPIFLVRSRMHTRSAPLGKSR